MKTKQFLLILLAVLLPLTSFADVWQDPETKVNYEYNVGDKEASVMEGFLFAGSPEATGDITILSHFSVDGEEYTVTSIGDEAFSDCTGIISVVIPTSVKAIGWQAFYGCTGLSSIIIPEGVVNIGEKAFYGCSAVSSLVISSTVREIGGYAFKYCKNVTSVKSFIQEPFTIDNSVFYNYYSTAALYVPAGAKSRYEATSAWNQFKSIEEFQNQQPTPTPKASAQTMVLHHADGTISEVDLVTKPVVRFQNEKVIVATTEGTSDYQKDNILRITYNYLRADVNGDNAVDVADIATVISVMAGNDVGGPVPARSVADVNGDGVVDVADIASVIDMMAELARRAQMPKKAEAATANGTIGEAFYIYRNDGQFNAFFREEIDSISFSHYDADSLRYNKIASQVVYTPDSTYMIPLVAIDSVGFVQPEKEFQPDVMRMDETWLPYVIKISENSITFSPSTPSAFLPQQGQVMVAETFESPFDTGFSGRVNQIKTYSDSIVCVVEEVLLADIYKRLVTVGMSSSEGAEESTSRAQKRIWGMNTDPGVKFPLPPITDLTVGPVTVSCSPTVILKYIVCLWEDNLKDYVDIRCYQTYDGSVSINAKLEKAYTPEPKWIGSGITVPTGVPGLYGRVKVGGFFRATGSVQLSATRKFYRNGVSGFVYSEDSGFRRINEWDNPPEEDWEASVSIDGSMSAGVAGRLQFGIAHEKLASADITLYVGPEISGHAELNATGLVVDKSLYSSIKDSEITLSIIADVVPGYQLAGFKSSKEMPEPPTHEDAPVSLKFTWPLNHWYLVPEFDNLKWHADANGGDLTGDIRRNLLPKVSLGWALYDEDDNLYMSEYFQETYRKAEDWPHQGMTYHFDNLKKNTTYKAYPMVKLLGVEMRTDKSVDVCVKECPVTLSDFKVTKKQHEKGAFYHDGKYYDYRFDVSVKATLDDDATGISEWGYAYLDPNGNEALIPLTSYGRTYTDTRYAYFRSGTPPFTCTLYGYAKYADSDEPVYGEPHDYPLEYGETSCPDENHPHWIDLGIGTQWRCCNEGASRPEEYGGYYTFGQVASAPTLEQIKALVNNCSYTWTTQNGVNGGKFTGPNGGTIFLPAAGDVWDGELRYVGSWGYYWSSTPRVERDAFNLTFYSGLAYWDSWDCDLRRYQLTVRPVR
jgi:hypothetical protein